MNIIANSLSNKNTCLSLAVLMVWFVIMYLANAWMPLYRDDYLAAVIWRTGDHIGSFADVFYSLERYYNMHGGRLVSFFFQFVFVWWGKVYFNFANALMFALLLPVMLMHCRRDFGWNKDPKTLVLLGVFLWLGTSHFGEVAIWLCGSAVYLWTGLFAAVFLLPYNLALKERFHSNSWLFALVMLCFGAIASCSVENLTVTTSALALCITYVLFRRKLFSPWMAFGSLGSVIGSLVCLLAPGNFARIIDDEDRSWLFHFLNQIPSNLEMLMYMMPVILSLVLAVKILKGEGEEVSESKMSLPYITGGILIIALVSFFTTGFFAGFLRDLVVAFILAPLNLTDDLTISHFDNTMAGFEEALIYILAVVLVYRFSRKSLGLYGKAKSTCRELLQKHEELRYGFFLMGLALINNFIVIGAPSFPGRALFSSSVIFVMGAVVILNQPKVAEKILFGPQGKIFRRGGLAIVAFIIVGTLTVLHSIWLEDAVRVAYIAKQAEAGVQKILVPPSAIPEQRRILRHIAYDDFDTGMTRDHICYYFGIGTVELDPKMKLSDIMPK